MNATPITSRNAAVVRRFDDGEAPAAIARSLGLSRERIRQILTAADRDGSAGRLARCDRKYQQAYQDWLRIGWGGGAKAARRHGLHQASISRWARERGLPTPTRPLPPHGTAMRYAADKCRCDRCTRANTIYCLSPNGARPKRRAVIA